MKQPSEITRDEWLAAMQSYAEPAVSGGITIAEFAEMSNLSVSTAGRIIRDMVKDGAAKSIGVRRVGRVVSRVYELVKQKSSATPIRKTSVGKRIRG